MPLKLPDIVKHPILCRYCLIEIPISQAALKVKPNDFDTIRLVCCYINRTVHSTQYGFDMCVRKVLSYTLFSTIFVQKTHF